MSYWNSSNSTPSWRPVATSHSTAPAIGPVVQPADADAAHAMAVAGEGRQRGDVARDEDGDARVALPFGEPLHGFGGRGEHDLDLGRHAHAIQLLLPGAGPDRVVHQHD